MRAEGLHTQSSVLHTFEKITLTFVISQERNGTGLLPVSQARQVSLCILVSMTKLSTSNKKLSVTNTTRMTQDPGSARGMGWWSQRFMHKMLWSQNYKIHKSLEQKT